VKIAVFADVHSNLYSLEAVLKDIESKGIDRVYCVGDLVGYGPRPNEVIELIRSKKIPAVMGNYDDAIGNMRLICGCDYKDEESLRLGEKSIAWTRDNTSDENKAWLRGLPAEIRETISGYILLVHGSPKALNEYLYESTPEEYFGQLLEESAVDVLVCGHTHLPYVKKVNSGLVINAGSVGKPKHGNPNATYITMEIRGKYDIGTDIVEVEYNYEQTAREIEGVGLPAEFARIIRTGRP